MYTTPGYLRVDYKKTSLKVQCQMTWPKTADMIWDEMNHRMKVKQSTSASRNVGDSSQLLEKMSVTRPCAMLIAVVKAKEAFLKRI